MPVIFASAILMFPAQLLNILGSATGMRFFTDFAEALARGEFAYYFIFGLLIFIFSYFWVSLMFKPVQIADDLKKNGGYIPGVRPGDPTAEILGSHYDSFDHGWRTFFDFNRIVPRYTSL